MICVLLSWPNAQFTKHHCIRQCVMAGHVFPQVVVNSLEDNGPLPHHVLQLLPPDLLPKRALLAGYFPADAGFVEQGQVPRRRTGASCYRCDCVHWPKVCWHLGPTDGSYINGVAMLALQSLQFFGVDSDLPTTVPPQLLQDLACVCVRYTACQRDTEKCLTWGRVGFQRAPRQAMRCEAMSPARKIRARCGLGPGLVCPPPLTGALALGPPAHWHICTNSTLGCRGIMHLFQYGYVDSVDACLNVRSPTNAEVRPPCEMNYMFMSLSSTSRPKLCS